MTNSTFIPIYEPISEGEFSIISSLLNEHNIYHFTKNQNLQSLFGVGTSFLGYNHITGPIKVMVNRKDEKIAKEIIDQYKANNNSTNIENEDIELNRINAFRSNLNSSIILGLIFPGTGIFNLLKAKKIITQFPDEDFKSGFKLFFSNILFFAGLLFWGLIIRIILSV